MRELCHKARELLIEEGNVVTVNAPVTVRLFFHSFFSSSSLLLIPVSGLHGFGNQVWMRKEVAGKGGSVLDWYCGGG